MGVYERKIQGVRMLKQSDFPRTITALRGIQGDTLYKRMICQMHLGDPNFLNAIKDSILASTTFTAQFRGKFTAKWLADRNNFFKGDLMNSFSNNQLFNALGTYNKPLVITKMDQSGVITLAYLNILNCNQLLGFIDAVNPGLIPALYMPNAPPLPVPMSPVATTRNNAICSNPAAKNNIYNILLVGSNRTTLLQALRSFPTPTLFTGISNWTSLRTNLLSEPLEYGYITTLYPMECNVFYNAYNPITLVNMIKDVDNYNFILKALDIKLVLAGNILAMQKAIMTFINDLSLYLNPTQMNNLWNSLLGTYGTHRAELSLSELDLYGSKRLGVIEDTISLNKFFFTGNYNPSNQRYDIYSYYSPTYTAIPNYNLTYWTYGKKKYELTNHLGNVLSTVSDYKIPYLNVNSKLCYKPDVRSENRYYAFGGMKDSGFVAGRKPRYSYQGSEVNNELDGIFNTLYRQGDVDGLVWLSVDPKWYLTPWQSPYSLMGGNPISKTDPLGDVDGDYHNQSGKKIGSDKEKDGKNYVVGNDLEASKIENGRINPKEAKSAIEIPSADARKEMGTAVERGAMPTADDPTGGLHEEGGLGMQDGRILHSKPGPHAEKTKTGVVAQINEFDLMDPSLLTFPSTVKFTFHLHSEGGYDNINNNWVSKIPTSNIMDDVNNSTFSSGNLKQYTPLAGPPSETDIKTAASNLLKKYITDACYELSPGENKVYIYTGEGTKASFPLNLFITLPNAK